ncbi:MAG: hypothetical protein ACRD3W_02160 [Terriglobales bacterium]
MLGAETLLHWDLRSKGHKLYLEPGATTAHTNFAVLSVFIKVQFHNGRVFGADRAQAWPFYKRTAYTLAAPLIPFVRLLRIARNLQARNALYLLIRALYMVLLGLIFDALGQCGGYAFGAGRSPEQIAQFEFHRERFSLMPASALQEELELA